MAHELHEKGLRLTPQRELVLSAVRSLGHATPEEVAEKVRSTHPGINLSTVYRNLETLENVGLVLHTHLGHGGATYHAAEELTHLHLVCSDCGEIGDAPIEAAANFVNTLRLMLHTLLFMDCARSAQKKMIKKSARMVKQNERGLS
jgi:Fur family ferric uptake transcriptional regulator